MKTAAETALDFPEAIAQVSQLPQGDWGFVTRERMGGTFLYAVEASPPGERRSSYRWDSPAWCPTELFRRL